MSEEDSNKDKILSGEEAVEATEKEAEKFAEKESEENSEE